MNCPNCGAENEAEAHFCTECGESLENQVDDETTIAGQFPVGDNSEKTILSTPSPVVEETETITVAQENIPIAAAETESDSVIEPEPEPDLPLSPQPPADSSAPARFRAAARQNPRDKSPTSGS